MNISEIREMINSTITSNGAGEITGNSLNAALMAIVDVIENGGTGNNGGTGSLGGALTILIPNNDSWDVDNTSVELLENNAQCFAALINQTEPLLVFLKKLGATKPFAQTSMRMRHLDANGEGKKYFAFGYPVPYTDEDRYGLLAYSDEMFAIEPSGSVRRITLTGKEYGTNADIFWEYDANSLDYINGLYTKSSSNTEVTIGKNDVEILNYDGETITIKGLFDSGIINDLVNVPVVDGKVIIDSIVAGGNELNTALLGPVQIPIELNIETKTVGNSTFVTKLYSDSPIGCYGSDGSTWYGVINDFTLTRDLPFKL